MPSPPYASSTAPGKSLTEGVQPPVVVEDIQGLVRDDRRQARSGAPMFVWLWNDPLCRIDVDQRAFRARHDQSSTGENRPG